MEKEYISPSLSVLEHTYESIVCQSFDGVETEPFIDDGDYTW